MRYFTGGGLTLLLGTALVAAGDKGQSNPATPAQQYQALLEESKGVSEELSRDKTDEERRKLLARLGRLPLDFLELAEQHPKDPVAVEALTQTVALVNGAFPAGGKDSPGSRALAILQRDHVQSDKLGPACQHVVFGFHQSHEAFLRAVLEMSPHKEVQGVACLSLAQFLSDRLNRLDILKDQVNYDGEDARKVKEVMDKGKLSWRSFVDRGAISEKWKPAGTPSFYVIDHGGVIRYKWAGAPGAKAIATALEKTIQEAERDAKKPLD